MTYRRRPLLCSPNRWKSNHPLNSFIIYSLHSQAWAQTTNRQQELIKRSQETKKSKKIYCWTKKITPDSIVRLARGTREAGHRLLFDIPIMQTMSSSVLIFCLTTPTYAILHFGIFRLPVIFVACIIPCPVGLFPVQNKGIGLGQKNVRIPAVKV